MLEKSLWERHKGCIERARDQKQGAGLRWGEHEYPFYTKVESQLNQTSTYCLNWASPFKIRLIYIKMEGSYFWIKSYLVLGGYMLPFFRITNFMFCRGWDLRERLPGVASRLSACIHIRAEQTAQTRRELWVNWKGMWKTHFAHTENLVSRKFQSFQEPINKDQNILTHHSLLNLLGSKHQQILIMVKTFAEKSLELLCVDLFLFI